MHAGAIGPLSGMAYCASSGDWYSPRARCSVSSLVVGTARSRQLVDSSLRLDWPELVLALRLTFDDFGLRALWPQPRRCWAWHQRRRIHPLSLGSGFAEYPFSLGASSLLPGCFWAGLHPFGDADAGDLFGRRNATCIAFWLSCRYGFFATWTHHPARPLLLPPGKIFSSAFLRLDIVESAEKSFSISLLKRLLRRVQNEASADAPRPIAH